MRQIYLHECTICHPSERSHLPNEPGLWALLQATNEDYTDSGYTCLPAILAIDKADNLRSAIAADLTEWLIAFVPIADAADRRQLLNHWIKHHRPHHHRPIPYCVAPIQRGPNWIADPFVDRAAAIILSAYRARVANAHPHGIVGIVGSVAGDRPRTTTPPPNHLSPA
jgi:hypothetical protein